MTIVIRVIMKKEEIFTSLYRLLFMRQSNLNTFSFTTPIKLFLAELRLNHADFFNISITRYKWFKFDR